MRDLSCGFLDAARACLLIAIGLLNAGYIAVDEAQPTAQAGWYTLPGKDCAFATGGACPPNCPVVLVVWGAIRCDVATPGKLFGKCVPAPCLRCKTTTPYCKGTGFEWPAPCNCGGTSC